MKTRLKKMGFNATWSMAVGGMVGGGIFSVLGVTVSIAGKWAWLSFLIGGLIALATAFAYSKLVIKFGESGGVFSFLRKIHKGGLAGSLSWILILGYTLTISVYAFTFGHYLANVFGLGSLFPRICAIAVIIILVWINLLGVGEASGLEIVTVWGKLLVLIGLAAFGLWKWHPEMLSQPAHNKNIFSAVEGAASIFMAYEGFQLLAYDYDEIKNNKKNLPLAMISAVISVIIVYIAVSLGTAMIVGANVIIKKEEVAIAVAGKAAFGTLGLILTTIAAVFSTGSAINATLFAAARLTEDVSKGGEIPKPISHKNKNGIPDRAIFIIGGIAIILSVIGSLERLVETASLVFLFTFTTVNLVAFSKVNTKRWIFFTGSLGAGVAGMFLCWRIIFSSPISMAVLIVAVLISVVGRPYLLGNNKNSV